MELYNQVLDISVETLKLSNRKSQSVLVIVTKLRSIVRSHNSSTKCSDQIDQYSRWQPILLSMEAFCKTVYGDLQLLISVSSWSLVKSCLIGNHTNSSFFIR